MTQKNKSANERVATNALSIPQASQELNPIQRGCLRCNSVFSCQHPVSTHMRNASARLATFDRRWMLQRLKVSPSVIIEDRFFFRGRGGERGKTG